MGTLDEPVGQGPGGEGRGRNVGDDLGDRSCGRALLGGIDFNDLLEVCDVDLGEVDAEIGLGEDDVHALAGHRGEQFFEFRLAGISVLEHRAVVRAEGEVTLIMPFSQVVKELDFLKIIGTAIELEWKRGLADLTDHLAVRIRVLMAEVLLGLILDVSQAY